MLTPEQLKGCIRNIAKEKDLSSQEVLQMYFFERVLARLALSPYKEHFILKGGFLIASMIGIDERTTMDMDTSVQGLPMEEDEIEKIICDILAIDAGDGIEFKYGRMEPIMEEADYNNFRVFFSAVFGKINNPMKIDISTGDVITPAAIDYSYRTIFGDGVIETKSYNLITVLAEKYETIIRRNIGNTRARDFYDLYSLYKMHKSEIDVDILTEAIVRTATKRQSLDDLSDWIDILSDMKSESALKQLWQNYQNNYRYAKDISYESLMECIGEIGTATHIDKQS